MWGASVDFWKSGALEGFLENGSRVTIKLAACPYMLKAACGASDRVGAGLGLDVGSNPIFQQNPPRNDASVPSAVVSPSGCLCSHHMALPQPLVLHLLKPISGVPEPAKIVRKLGERRLDQQRAQGGKSKKSGEKLGLIHI